LPGVSKEVFVGQPSDDIEFIGMKGPITDAGRTVAMAVLVAVCFYTAPAVAFLSGDDKGSQPSNAPPASASTDPDAFDGRWTFTSAGCRYTGSVNATIKHGRVVVRGGGGQVSPDGTIHTVGAGGGMTLTAEGRLDGDSGSGTFDRSDGCLGTWIAIKRR
jgi:hypothetical protein